MTHCPKCVSAAPLDLTSKGCGPRVLEHIGAHILCDQTMTCTEPLCGLCLRPPALCQYYLKKGKGAKASLKIDEQKSRGCLVKVSYNFKSTSRSTKGSPCSNMPITCPVCPSSDPAIWRYFLKDHFRQVHGPELKKKYVSLWELTNFEEMEMKKIWRKRGTWGIQTASTVTLGLQISDAHRAGVPVEP